MNLRQLMMSSSLAAMVVLSSSHAFAAGPVAAASDAAVATVATTVTPGAQAGDTKKSVRAANRAFSRTVQKTLSKTQGLEDTSITVFGKAKTGQVTLAGQIASEDQDRLAVDTAKQVHGVTAVTSKLTLRQQGGG